MTDTDRINAIADANKIWLFDALTEIRDMADQFDTTGESDRVRVLVNDIIGVAEKAGVAR